MKISSLSPGDSRIAIGDREDAGPVASRPVAVAVVNTPLHVWQVREACAQRGVPTRDVWVAVFKQASVNGETLERTLNGLGEWGRVSWLEPPPLFRKGWGGVLSVVRRDRHRADWQCQLAEARGAQVVMVALNRLPINRQVAAWFSGEELIWVDDGTMTTTPALIRKDAARGAVRPLKRKGRARTGPTGASKGASTMHRAKASASRGKGKAPRPGARKSATARQSALRRVKRLVKWIPGTVWVWRRIKPLARRMMPRGGAIRALDRRLQRYRGLVPCTTPSLEIEPVSFKSAYPRTQAFFTVAETWPLPPGRWVPNRLHWLRTQLQAAPTDAVELHFLGAPLVERDGVPSADYIDWLRRVQQAWGGTQHMVYIPHPWESDDFLARLAHALEIEVRPLGLPYEIALATMERRPAAVASWFCLALEHLEVVGLPDLELVAYRIPEFRSTLSKKRKGKTAAIFGAADAFYRRHEGDSGIDVRRVPDPDDLYAADSGQSAPPAIGAVGGGGR